jgi:hypothetical protein
VNPVGFEASIRKAKVTGLSIDAERGTATITFKIPLSELVVDFGSTASLVAAKAKAED